MGKARKKSDKRQDPDLTRNVARDDDDDADDMETFYNERDDNLRTSLAKTTQSKYSKNKKSVSWAAEEDDGRDEVLAFDDDSMGSDDDDQYEQFDDADQEDDDTGEDLSGAWGTAKKTFYNEDANVDDEDAKLEEQEAVQIQKRYYDMLEKNDFSLDLFRAKPSVMIKENNVDEQTLRRHIILPDNLLDLSVNERLQLIRDQSPELEALCYEFKTIFDDLKIYLLPFVQLVLDTSSLEEFQTYSGWQFVLAVLELYLIYCSYLSLYLTMKSTDINLLKHPIVNDIEQYRKLCQLIQNDFQSMKSDLLKLCELLQEKKSKINQALSSKQNEPVSQARLIMNNGISFTKTTTVRSRVLIRSDQCQTVPKLLLLFLFI